MNTQRYKQFLKPLCLLKETPVCVSRSVLSCLFRPHELQPTRLLCPWGFSKQEYWSGLSYPSPQHLPNPGIASTQTQGLPYCRQIINHLSPQGSPRILEWVAYPFSRGSSWPRNQTGVSWIAGRFFTSWATREAFREIACLHYFETPHCGEGSCGEETFWRPQEKKASSSLHSRLPYQYTPQEHRPSAHSG